MLYHVFTYDALSVQCCFASQCSVGQQ